MRGASFAAPAVRTNQVEAVAWVRAAFRRFRALLALTGASSGTKVIISQPYWSEPDPPVRSSVRYANEAQVFSFGSAGKRSAMSSLKSPLGEIVERCLYCSAKEHTLCEPKAMRRHCEA